MVMDRERLLEEMQAQNPWWTGSKPDLPEKFVKRPLQERVEAELEDDIVTAITGLRRSGKTTLTHGVISDLLETVDSKNIIYFSFDLAEGTDVRKVLDLYSEEVLEKTFSEVEDRVYVFLDEVQKLEDWADHVKSIHDKGYSIKFLVTGSSSMNITKGAGESLVGRVIVRRLYPFSFRSYCDYNEVEYPKIELENISYPQNAKRLRIQFNRYFEQGGFPELYEDYSEENLSQNLDLTLFRDVASIFSVNRTDLLKKLFRLTAENTAQVVNYNNFSQDLDVQYRTVKDYLQHLEDAFLLKSSMPHSSNTRKSMRKNPKLYISDHSYNRLYSAKEGLRAETVAFNHLKRLEDPKFKKRPEVDILLPETGKAFEVKYQDDLDRRDARNLTELPEKYDLYMVSRDTYDEWKVEGREIKVVPLWLICLAVS